jgi:hypothetical protein
MRTGVAFIFWFKNKTAFHGAQQKSGDRYQQNIPSQHNGRSGTNVLNY